MRENFEKSVELTLPFEGGYSNHPRDPGGPTMKGVTLATFSSYLGRQATIPELKAITDDQIRGVARMYWNPLRCDDLPAGVDYAMFDRGWGSGPGTAARALQRIVGVAADGRIGPITLAAVAKWEPHALIREIARTYLAFMQSLSTWDVFGAGWTRRVNGVRDNALKMADEAGTAASSPPSQPDDPGPDPIPDPETAPEVSGKAFPTKTAIRLGVLAVALVALRKPIAGLFRWSKDWLESGNTIKALAVAALWTSIAGVLGVVFVSLL